jgi:type IV pilus assembly protein PilA
MLRTRDEGFALIELLVVILIIGVLAGIGLAMLVAQQRKAMDISAKSDVRNAVTQIESCLSEATDRTAPKCARRADNPGLGKLKRILTDGTSSLSNGALVYSITASSKSSATYTISKAADGSTTYSSSNDDAKWAESSTAAAA